MGILYTTGFETGATPLPSLSGSGSIASGGVSGNYVLSCGQNNNYTLDLGFEKNEIYIGLHALLSSNGALGNNISFLTTTGHSISISRSGLGTFSLASSVFNITGPYWGFLPSSYYNMQIYIRMHETTGEIKLRISGNDYITRTGDTRAHASSSLLINRLRSSRVNWSIGTHFIDNLIVRDDRWPGDVRIVPQKPNSDTAVKDWVPSTGTSNYTLINTIPLDTSTYVESETDGNSDLYGVENLGYTGFNIEAVAHVINVHKTTAETQKIIPLLKSGQTLVEQDPLNMLTTRTTVTSIHEIDPNTGFPWEPEALDDLEIGQKYTS